MSVSQDPIHSALSTDPEMSDLVEEFVDSLQQRVSALRDAVSDGDLTAVTRLAHQLKGSCGGYGFEIIGRAAGVLEQAAKATAEVQTIEAQVRDLIDLCGRATAKPPA